MRGQPTIKLNRHFIREPENNVYISRCIIFCSIFKQWIIVLVRCLNWKWFFPTTAVWNKYLSISLWGTELYPKAILKHMLQLRENISVLLWLSFLEICELDFPAQEWITKTSAVKTKLLSQVTQTFQSVLIDAFSKCFIKLSLKKTGSCRWFYFDSLLSSLYHPHKKLQDIKGESIKKLLREAPLVLWMFIAVFDT